jgi:lipoprotein-releasing system permease protein
VRGLFDVGNKGANDVWVLVALRDAQTLLDLTGGVSSIELRASESFAAEAIAGRLRARTGLEVESWMAANAELLTALRSQASSSIVIQVFVVLAVAIGIASVLVVSVIQRSREIGILRAMGMSRGRITRIFLLQGALVGVGGSLLGSGLGAVLALVFSAAVTDASGDRCCRSCSTPAVPELLGGGDRDRPARRAAAGQARGQTRSRDGDPQCLIRSSSCAA